MSTGNEATPHYLELLNTIALGERRAGIYLKEWAGKTTDPDLKSCLSLVAARETSHYDIFNRRIEELGHSLVDQDDPELAERLRVSGSDMTDIEKIQWLRGRPQPNPNMYDRATAAIADDSVDALTRSFLSWFLDVESDSGGLMAKVYSGIEAKAG